MVLFFKNLLCCQKNIDHEEENYKWNQTSLLDLKVEAEELSLKYGKISTHIENLKMYEFTSLTTIGSGGFSIVKKGYSKKFKRDIAVKIILLDQKENESYIKKYLHSEVSFWKELSSGLHINIVNLIEAVEAAKVMYFIMDLVDKGDLDQYLLKGPMTSYKAKAFFKDIVEAVNYCHGKSIAHRDIKPKNLLVDNNDRIRLTDFSFVTKSNPVSSERCGTPNMLAPEQVSCSYYDPFKSDVWQLGLTLYTMLTQKMPYKSVRKDKLEQEVVNLKNVYKSVPYPKNILITVSCKELIGGMLEFNYIKRYNIEQVKDSNWLLDF
ncbi:testis-specific serine/threonine-protein kinase 3 [Hydra vulgaris]|uniref:testis-specific serine/threonine-protein kinase 3 n=1 Tax=Hydra vulgaris TaxID=6087 RepID=UPI0032EA6437